jgi:hypothetical protein
MWFAGGKREEKEEALRSDQNKTMAREQIDDQAVSDSANKDRLLTLARGASSSTHDVEPVVTK